MKVNLVLFKKNGSTKAFPLPQDVTVIGRQQQCDFCVPLMIVSRKHCEINQDQGILRVRDLTSRNGTFVNGKKVAEAVLNPGDKVQVGPVSFVIQIDGEPANVSASDSDILHAPAHLGDSAEQPGEQDEDFSIDEVDTMHHGNIQDEAEEDEDDDLDFFDDLIEGAQGENPAS
ncbi:MAG: FHA domain-containing protein [Phycisphaerae bacterium]|nr:FHA domain-containing protein [Phycisphaerae bacterium]